MIDTCGKCYKLKGIVGTCDECKSNLCEDCKLDCIIVKCGKIICKNCHKNVI